MGPTSQLTLCGHKLGEDDPVFVIAEAGVNHNGSLALAKELILAAKAAGADCVKFQTFTAERVVTLQSPKAKYQLETTDPAESQLDMLRSLELGADDFAELCRFSRESAIAFLSTPYSIEDADLLDEIGIDAFKIASGQLVELHFLEQLAAKGKPILLSTGMGTLAEVVEAVEVIRAAGNDDIVVLQCHTNYPTDNRDAHLRAMATMGEATNAVIGYSDHTQSVTAALVATALGARVIERHLTLDRCAKGPDHACSSTPEEFEALVRQIREVEMVLGSAEKAPTAAELRNMAGMRRSFVAKLDIPANTTLGWEHLELKRPGTGILGNRAPEILGRSVASPLAADSLISEDALR